MSVKKILASVLLVCMILSMGTVAFAADSDVHVCAENGVLVSTLKPATCTTNGVGKFACKVCGGSFYGTIVGGHTTEGVEGTWVDATCTTNGGELVVCTTCGEELFVEAKDEEGNYIDPARGHGDTYLKDEKGANACTHGVTGVYVCYDCGEEIEITGTSGALGHAWSEGEYVDADCEYAAGLLQYCTRCGLAERRIDAVTKEVLTPNDKGHKWEKIEEVKATCMNDGYVFQLCMECGKEDYTDLPKQDDAHVWEKEVMRAADCKAGVKGIVKTYCTECGTSSYAYDEGHEKVLNEKTYKAPTCTEDGFAEYTCALCEKELPDETIEALGHKMAKDVIIDATCDYNAYKVKEACEVCGYHVTGTNVIEIFDETALGHDWVKTGEVIDCVNGKIVESYKCNRCNKTDTKEVSTGVVGHDWDETQYYSFDKATCEHPAGNDLRRCNLCGLYRATGTTEAIDPKTYANAHSYKTESIQQEATCQKPGKETQKCEYCGDIKKDVEIAIVDCEYTVLVETLRAGDCTNSAIVKMACKWCGDTTYKVTEPAHKWEPIVDKDYVAATCTKEGSANHVCTVCLKEEVRVIPMEKHAYEMTFVEPNCLEDGYLISRCSVCKADEIGKDGKTITEKVTGAEKLGHDMKMTDRVADCAENTATEIYTCQREGCGYEETKDLTLNTNGKHTWGELIEGAGVDTCLAPTADHQICEVCGSYYFPDLDVINSAAKQEEMLNGRHNKGEGLKLDPKASVAATCQSKGLETWVCLDCGLVDQKELDKDPNNHETTVIETLREQTCAVTGIYKITCAYCKDAKPEYITKEATGKHAYGPEYVSEGGTQILTKCAVCGDVKVLDYVDGTECGEVAVPAVPATCEHDGKTAGIKCAVVAAGGTCDIHPGEGWIVAPETIKGGHAWNEGEVVAEATATTDGLIIYTCTVKDCGATKTEVIPAIGHEHAMDEGTVTVEPTCTTEGEIAYVCTVEGCEYFEVEALPMIDHAYDEGEVTVEATEETVGEMTYTCTVCGATKTEEIAVLEHTHVWNDGEVTTASTCSAEGVKTFTCTKCGATETEAVAKISHTYTVRYSFKKDADTGEYVMVDGEYVVQKTSTCSVCGDVVIEP